MKPTENVTANGKAKGTVRVLKLEREALRELDAAALSQAQGGDATRRGGRHTRRCDTGRACVHAR